MSGIQINEGNNVTLRIPP